jgi:hypothetical protein
MSCCSKHKKRWPMIVFLIVLGSVILIAVLADAQTRNTSTDIAPTDQSQVLNAPSSSEQACSGHTASEPSCCAKPPQKK